MTAHDKRNPYGILGIPFGASRDVASRAFARKARGLRRQADGTERLLHLTWALNQIEEAVKDPRTALQIYRVPADAGALEPDQPGILRPPPELMPRATQTSEGDWRSLLDASRSEAQRAIRSEVAATSSLPPR